MPRYLWLAPYSILVGKWRLLSPNDKCAIVIYSDRDDINIGDRVTFDSTCVDAVCPNCGSTRYISSGINWRCKDCDRQWRRDPKPKGGVRAGAGRKANARH